MPERVTANRVKEFVQQLEALGGASGNGRLRDTLKWDQDFYWRVQGKLVEEGRIVPGRGKGGSVRLTVAESESEPPASIEHEATIQVEDGESIPPPRRRLTERPLYEPIRKTMEATWIHRFGFDDVKVEETHSQGSKSTGGTFTRPDITVVGVRRYVFLSKRLEVVTFEIKPADSVGIIGVLEAIAHREAAHRAYVIFALSRVSFEISAEAERIIELAQKYGIGLIVTEDPNQVASWEILIDAVRHEPDPARLDRFLGDLPSEPLKKQLHKWMT